MHRHHRPGKPSTSAAGRAGRSVLPVGVTVNELAAEEVLPVRIELAASGRGWVDVHPVTFDAVGYGRQAAPDGEFDYPPEAFTTSTLGGRLIPCLSASQQQRFHSGYEPTAKDRHDLAQLQRLESR